MTRSGVSESSFSKIRYLFPFKSQVQEESRRVRPSTAMENRGTQRVGRAGYLPTRELGGKRAVAIAKNLGTNQKWQSLNFGINHIRSEAFEVIDKALETNSRLQSP